MRSGLIQRSLFTSVMVVGSTNTNVKKLRKSKPLRIATLLTLPHLRLIMFMTQFLSQTARKRKCRMQNDRIGHSAFCILKSCKLGNPTYGRLPVLTP